MGITRALSERISAMPFSADTGHRTFDLDASDDNIELAPGAYTAYLPSSAALGYARIGSAVSVPATEVAEIAGQFLLIPGGTAVFVVGGAATIALHAQLSSGTGTLHLMRMPL